MIRIPSKATLRKYGLSEQEFLGIWKRQGSVCPICLKEPSTGNVVIDHYHHPQYKKLPADLRRLMVRGIVCWYDNRWFLTKTITVEKSERITKYLKSFEMSRPNGTPTKNHT